jgi:hypothetical protein
MKIKKQVKRFLKKQLKAYSKKSRLFNCSNAFIVGGMGRCGTKLICDSLKKSGIVENDVFLDRFNTQIEYKNGFYYKTHDYPPEYLPGNVKLIYMFGNPMNTAISAHKKINEWGHLHHYHLNSNLYRCNDELFHKDTLLLQSHFDAWYKEQKFDFISIKYEALYEVETIETLNRFLGFPIKLIPFEKRDSDYRAHPQSKIIINTYRDLYDKVKAADNVKVWRLGKMDEN